MEISSTAPAAGELWPAKTEPVWVDIKDVLKDAAQEMQVGEMLTTPYFTLHEAMSAIELMDPQMDSGMQTDAITSLEDALAKGALPLELSPLQILAVMDRLVACEVAWYTGNGIAQTVFTCLYLHDRALIKDPALACFVQCMLRTCALVRTVVVEGDVYEEEDFVTHTGGYTLPDQSTEQEMLREIQEVEKSLHARIKAIKAFLKNGEALEEVDGLYPSMAPEDPSMDLAICEAFLARLMFRRGYFSIHQHLRKPQCKGCAAAVKSIVYANQQLELVLQSLPLTQGIPAPGFEPHCNRRMLAPTPPRVCPILEVPEAYASLQTYLGHLTHLTTIESADTYPKLVQFMFDFAESYPNVVARSWWEVLVMQEWMIFGTQPILEFIWKSVKDFGVVDDMRSSPEVGPFMQMVGKVIQQLFRIFGLNRARQRRKLAVAFGDWSILQAEATKLDEIIFQVFPVEGRVQPFSTWVVTQTLTLISVHINLGFELQLYAPPHEYRTQYWYAGHVFSIRQQLAQMVQNYAEARAESDAAAEAAAAPVAAPSKGGKKGKDKGKDKAKDKAKEKKKADKKAAAKGPKLSPEQLYLEAQRLLSRGLLYALSRLKQTGALKDKEYTFGDLRVRYEKRFAPYSKLLQPAPIGYDSYVERTDLVNAEPEKLALSCVECFRQAQVQLDKMAKHSECPKKLVGEAKKLAAVSAANLVMALRLCPSKEDGCLPPPPSNVTISFGEHPTYLVLSLDP